MSRENVELHRRSVRAFNSRDVEGYFDLGERTIAVGRLHGRGRHSGAEVVLAGLQALTWRDSVAVYYKAYTDKDTCLRDLGVSEAELEPIDP